MTNPPIDPDRVGDTLLTTMLAAALKEIAVAFARANKTAALFTLAAIERELLMRAEEFAAQLASPSLPEDTRARIAAAIVATMSDVQRAAEDASLH